MKNAEQIRSLFATAQGTTGNPKPVAPLAAQQSFSGRNHSDPSSVLRSDRYPIPAFAETRLRVRD